MLAIRQSHAFVAQVTIPEIGKFMSASEIVQCFDLPSNIAGANVGSDTFSMGAGSVLVFADGNGAGIEGVDQGLVIRFFPASQTDDVEVFVTEVAVGFLFRGEY